jgi:hypothetical protein
MANPTSDPKSIAADIARELREHPDNWFQGDLVRYGNGTTSSDVGFVGGVCWCLEGHIMKRTGIDGANAVFAAFREAIDKMDLFRWNDQPGRTVEDVIELCEKVSHG